MSLLSLSNELSLEIISNFMYETDIHSLMRVTGRLYYLLSPVLYRFVEAGALDAKTIIDRETIKKTKTPVSGNVVRLSLLPKVFISSQGWIRPVRKGDDKRKYEIVKTSPLYTALVSSQGPVLQVLVNYLKIINGVKEKQSSVIEDMGAALRELYALGITVAKSDGEEFLGQAAGMGDLVAIHYLAEQLLSSFSKLACDSGSVLIRAAFNIQVSVLQPLLSARNNKLLASTTLESAALNNSIEAAQLILKYHEAAAYPSTGVYAGNSLRILETTGSRGYKAMAELLLSHINVKIKVLSSRDYGALMVTADTCRLTEIVQWVFEKDYN